MFALEYFEVPNQSSPDRFLIAFDKFLLSLKNLKTHMPSCFSFIFLRGSICSALIS